MITSLSTLSLQISFLIKQDNHREHSRKDKEENLFLHIFSFSGVDVGDIEWCIVIYSDISGVEVGDSKIFFKDGLIASEKPVDG